MKKKVLAMVLGMSMLVSMSACGGSKAEDTSSDAADTKTEDAAETTEQEETTEEAATEEASSGDTYKIAIVKQMDHASLDEIANAIAAEFDTIAADNGVNIEYEIYSGQGEQTTLKQIGDQAIADGVDAIVPIATMAAQVMTVCA